MLLVFPVLALAVFCYAVSCITLTLQYVDTLCRKCNAVQGTQFSCADAISSLLQDCAKFDLHVSQFKSTIQHHCKWSYCEGSGRVHLSWASKLQRHY